MGCEANSRGDQPTTECQQQVLECQHRRSPLSFPPRTAFLSGYRPRSEKQPEQPADEQFLQEHCARERQKQSPCGHQCCCCALHNPPPNSPPLRPWPSPCRSPPYCHSSRPHRRSRSSARRGHPGSRSRRPPSPSRTTLPGPSSPCGCTRAKPPCQSSLGRSSRGCHSPCSPSPSSGCRAGSSDRVRLPSLRGSKSVP